MKKPSISCHEAVRILTELNEILKAKPIAEAVMGEKYEKSLQKLMDSGRWRLSIRDFKMHGGKAYGRARLVDRGDRNFNL